MRGGERSNERAIRATGSSGGAQRQTRGSSVQHWQPGGRASISRRIVVLVLAAMLTATAYHLSVGPPAFHYRADGTYRGSIRRVQFGKKGSIHDAGVGERTIVGGPAAVDSR